MCFCVGINLGPLKQGALYCYLDLQVALEKKIKVTFSKIAQVVLVEDRVPPELSVLLADILEPSTI